MQAMHPNVQRVLQGLAAFHDGDLEGVKAIYRPDLVFRVAGRGPLAGEYRGAEAYAAVVRRVREESGGTMNVEMDVILADDRTVMMLARHSRPAPGADAGERKRVCLSF